MGPCVWGFSESGTGWFPSSFLTSDPECGSEEVRGCLSLRVRRRKGLAKMPKDNGRVWVR